PNVLLAPSHPITQLLLSFTLVCKETRRLAQRYLLQHCVYLANGLHLSSYLLTIPTRPELRNITALFLAPFGDTIDSLPTATWVRELFGFTCSTLRRLIIDMPLRTCHAEDDHLGVRAVLREGFSRLENLEEFVSVQDELYLVLWDENEAPFWTRWKRLKRLAIYNPDVEDEFFEHVGKLPELETLVLTRADSLQTTNLKREYFRHCQKPLKVLLFNVDGYQIRFSRMLRAGWDTVDPGRKMTISTYTVPLLFENDCLVETCQDYVRIGAENGTLWGWEGEMIQ
ncbi:hypothetical protein K458DRAFT_279906, partial [Lentithecium fluviatile CBS 122367]